MLWAFIDDLTLGRRGDFLVFYFNKKFLEFLLWSEQYAKRKKSK